MKNLIFRLQQRAHRPGRFAVRVIRTVTCSVVSVCVLQVLAVNVAAAKSVPLRATYAGAITTTEIDLNADEEETARTSQGTGNGSLIGPFVFHEIRESDVLMPDHPDNRCGAGELENIEVHWTMVWTDQVGRNQLFFELAEDQPHVICIDPDDPPGGGLSRRHNFDIIGGTNRFANASGEVTVECRGFRLAAGDGLGGPAHGAVSCSMSGAIDF